MSFYGASLFFGDDRHKVREKLNVPNVYVPHPVSPRIVDDDLILVIIETELEQTIS